MATKLSEDEVDTRLQALNGWTLKEGKLFRAFKFRDFVHCWAFMSAAALEIEKLNHHPDWSNSYNALEVAIVTHTAGGITELDFKLAEMFNRLERSF